MDEQEFDEIQENLDSRDLFEFAVDKYTFTYRPLTIKEMSYISKPGVNLMDLEDYFVKLVTVDPPNFNFDRIKAGFVTQYVEDILKQSGYSDLGVINELLERRRALADQNIIAMMKTYVLTAMPAYKPSDFDDMTMNDFSELLVLAESIITTQQQMSGVPTEGFKLVISPVNGEIAVDTGEQRPAKVGKRKAKPMSDEEHDKIKRGLIQSIKAQNKELFNPLEQDQPVLDLSEFEKMPVEKLKAIAGIRDENDPIAAKLKYF